jgi:hypothetical protein
VKTRLCLVFVAFLAAALECPAVDSGSVDLGAWYGWGASLGDYSLSGTGESLDLDGQLSGGAVRLNISLPKEWYEYRLWFDYTGSYMLTGGTYDVLRRMDLALGGTVAVPAFRYLQPFLSAALLYSDYLLFLPHHPVSSSGLHLLGLRFSAGVVSEILCVRFKSWAFGLTVGPEYVLELLFSGTPILLNEVRGRLGVEFWLL